MSIDFPSYSGNTASAAKTADIQTLKESFAAALRNYSSENSSTQTDTMLEILQTAQENSAELRKQDRLNQQQQNEPEVAEQIDQKLQNQSELRRNEMNSDYQNQRDRQETFRQDYQEKVERNVYDNPEIVNSKPQPAEGIPMSASETSAPIIHTEIQPSASAISPPIPAGSVPSASVNVFGESAPIPQSAAPLISANPVQPAVPSVAAPIQQAVNLSAFTIFTASKRFGQNQDNQEEKEEESGKEETPGEVLVKKVQPFAFFEAIKLTERKRQPIENPPEDRRQKTIESEPNHSSVIAKNLDDVLNAVSNAVGPQKDEPSRKPEQSPLFHRIAAACEAAAQYAPIRIKVHLGKLGTMTLRFYYQSEKLMLQFETPSEESAEFLHEHLEELKTILTKRNVRLESASIIRKS